MLSASLEIPEGLDTGDGMSTCPNMFWMQVRACLNLIPRDSLDSPSDLQKLSTPDKNPFSDCTTQPLQKSQHTMISVSSEMGV